MQMAQHQVSCMHVWVPPSPGSRHRRFTDQPIAFFWSPNTLLIQCFASDICCEVGCLLQTSFIGLVCLSCSFMFYNLVMSPKDQNPFLPVPSRILHSWQEGETRARTDKSCTQWLSGHTWKLAVNFGVAVPFSKWPTWKGCRTEQPALEGISWCSAFLILRFSRARLRAHSTIRKLKPSMWCGFSLAESRRSVCEALVLNQLQLWKSWTELIEGNWQALLVIL